MKIDHLTLTNYRCFKTLKIDFHSQLTVLVAANGKGKTAILDAIRIAMWPYVSAFDVVSGTMPKSGIDIDDVMVHQSKQGTMEQQLPSIISAQATYQNRHISWSRTRTKVSKNSQTSVKEAKSVAEIGTALQTAVRMNSEHDTEEQHAEILLPVVAHYGTARLWKQRKLTLSKQDKSAFFSRTFAYVGCLDSASDYKYFQDWFFYIYAADFEQKTQELEHSGFSGLFSDNVRYGKFIEAIAGPVNIVLKEQGWSRLRYSPTYQTIVMHHPKYGELKVDQLSDGLRIVIALIADIAYRCVRLNPQLAERAPKLSHGMVLIDEIDMHLHPAWQQTIVASLQMAFPNIQFIVTTHSPQVLSTVPDESIRIISEGEIHSAPKGSKGAESSRLLKRILGVDVRPPEDDNTQLLNRYLERVYADHWQRDDAIEMRTQLNQIFADEEPALTEADLYIENRQWELDLEKDQ